MAKVRRSTLAEPIPLVGWSLCSSSAESPEELRATTAPDAWLAIDGPTTVAAALRSHGLWDFGRPRPFDSESWWYRCRIPAARPIGEGSSCVLRI